ncbi:MAG: YjbQ family protein [Chloroflexi bacterium]|nr:YjbQ family protein [Chloroflexota bacterium]
MKQLTVRSNHRQELIDITSQVGDAIRGWDCSAVAVFVPHTTAGVLVNEHADPDVARDILAALDRMVPADGSYRHAEGNSPAHVKTTLVGTSQLLPIERGRLSLGTWQGVFLAEFDGPRSRLVLVVPLAS